MTVKGIHGYPLPEVVNPDGVKCIVVKLPDDPAYIHAFWGQMDELARWRAWDRDDAKTGKDAASVMWQYLTWMENCSEVGTVSECEFCCTETNELLQEILDALGASEGGNSSVNTTLDILLQNNSTTIYNTYLGDWTDVHEDIPDTTYTEDTGDEAGDEDKHEIVLCATIEGYTDTVWDTNQAALSFAREVLQMVAAGAIATGAVIPGLLILLGTVIWDAIDDELFANDEAKKKVRCCMFSNLEDASPGDFGEFAASVEDCSFDEQSDEGLLAGLIHSANITRVNHALFLLHMGRLWVAADDEQLHSIDNCVCQETPPDCWDFEDGLRQGWVDAEGTVFDLTAQPDGGQIMSDLPTSVNGHTLGSWGEGSNLGVYVELPDETDVSHYAFRVWYSGTSIGRPYWLRFFDENKILIWQRTGSFAGGQGWYTLDENTPYTLSDVKYVAFTSDHAWRCALDVLRINAWGVAACS